MSILWSDDCLSCLAGLPHTLKQHMEAVTRAHEELQEELSTLRQSVSDEEKWEEDETVVTIDARGPDQ